MKLTQMSTPIEAEHGVVSSFPHDFFGYFGWPTLAKMDDGALVAAASGLRNDHACPFGRNLICTSVDEGTTWTSPRVVNDSPLDDRDTGAVCLGGDKLMLSWFTIDNRQYWVKDATHRGMDLAAITAGRGEGRNHNLAETWQKGFDRVTDESAKRWLGSWICTSDDRGDSWQPPVRVPLTAPHGPIRLRNGELLYFGKEFPVDMEGYRRGIGSILAMKSTDTGRTWEKLGTVPLHEGTEEDNYYEPHVAELPDGRLLGLIRFQMTHKGNRGDNPIEQKGLVNFSLFQSVSEDGGETWSRAMPLGFHGSPPHLLVHSSGALICVYGYRQEPYGERIMISRDGGASWVYDYVLRADGPDRDLGYPSTVELDDGRLLTMYYQKRESSTFMERYSEEKCSLLWSRWTLPE